MLYHQEPLFKPLPSYLKILVFLLLVLASMLLTSLLGIVFAIPFFGVGIMDMLSSLNDLSDPTHVSLLKYFQVINQIGLFLIPSLLFAYLVNRKVWEYVSLNKQPRLLTLILGTVSLVVALPLVSWLAQMNELLQLPDSWSGIENWMMDTEEQAGEMIQAFLSNGSIGGLLFNLFMIAVIPAIGEELFFRAVLIRLFREWFKNVHVAVLVSSLVFSALHMQFYGFLPRFFLGMILGYLFVWSGSLWVPVIVHFINNGLAVLAMYLYNRGAIDSDVESIGNTDVSGLIVLSAGLVVLLLVMIYSFEKRVKQT